MTQKPIPNLEIPQDLESKYVNFVRIAHTVSEFVLDFSLLLPGVTKFEVNSRLMMSPTAAKLFLQALTENLKRYETNFGKITIPGSHSLADDLFRPIDPPEGS
ncbi:MAG: DUF3467 domain-containing protein [Anaerolineaceae bacterium]